jgi:AraC-like DNA-binding protein
LSEKLNIQKTQLTFLLNAHMGVNFFTYINNYRLQKVLDELADPKKAHLKILAIAFDCGFNSKSTFNNLFKKHTGNTPSEYRQKHLKITSE